MTINSLKDLDKLMALCRKRGVKTITVGAITLTMDENYQEPIKRANSPVETQEVYTPGDVGPQTQISLPDALTEEQLMFYSADQGQQ